MIFRFDDICINSNASNDWDLTGYLFNRFPGCKIIWAVAPLVFNDCGERIYPEILNAKSDIANLLKVQGCGIPEIHPEVIRAGHGMWHIDHRLMGYEFQAASIISSCALVNGKVFVPPFNKYNNHTIEICKSQGIELIKFEDGWKCMEHEKYEKETKMWYLHARHWTVEKMERWLSEFTK